MAEEPPAPPAPPAAPPPGFAPAPSAPPGYPGAPGYGPPAYPVFTYGPYYPAGAPAPAFPPPPANRAWPAQAAVGRMRVACSLAAAAFLMGAILRLAESSTGVSDIPGSQAAGTATTLTTQFLLRGGELTLVGFAAAVGASALFPLRQSAKLLGQPDAQSLRRGVGFLAGACTLTTMVTVMAWLFSSSSQQAIPGTGGVSDPLLNRLFNQYRIALAVSATAGTLASFAFVLGLQQAWGALLGPRGRREFGRFARLFTLAASANLALVVVLFFGVIAAPTLDAPAGHAWSQGLLALGPVVAASSFLFLRRALARVEENATALSRGPAVPKA